MPTPPAECEEFEPASFKDAVLELFNAIRCGLIILQCANPRPSADCLPKCSIKYANKTFCRSFGVRIEEIRGKSCQEAFSGGVLDLARNMAGACQCHASDRRLEIEGPKKDTCYETQVHRLGNGYCFIVFYDISALKQSEKDLTQALQSLQKEHAWSEAILNTITDPLCVISPDFKVLYESPGAQKIWGNSVGQKCHEVYQHRSDACENCQCAMALADGQVHIMEKTMTNNGEERVYELVASPIKDSDGHIPGVIEVARDITARKALEKGKERLIMELQSTLAKMKRLSGLLPICSYCKKIRDDKGYWNQLESYMRSHADVEFSHGICEECARKNHPDIYKK